MNTHGELTVELT